MRLLHSLYVLNKMSGLIQVLNVNVLMLQPLHVHTVHCLRIQLVLVEFPLNYEI